MADTIFLSRERRYLYVSYFTSKDLFFIVPLNTSDEEIRKIDLYLEILEKSGVAEVIKNAYLKQNKAGRKSYNPYHLFSLILYSFAMKRGSLRDAEEFCRYDLRAWYLMNQETPSYKTIAEFINEVIVPNTYEIFTLITKTIIQEFRIDISDQYLDGTKIEANANKYRFVWKPKKLRSILDQKIRGLLQKMESPFEEKGYISSRELYSKLHSYSEKEGVVFSELPSGKGRRLTQPQRLLKLGMNYLSRLLDYEEKEEICGPNRNSYYKTDHDATAMALKTDYYSGHGSNMHAAYNVQFLVSAGIITFFGVFQDRTDYHTLIPLLKEYHSCYSSYPDNLCADSGYGIEDNYEYLSANGIGNYIKFLNWNGEKSAEYPQLFFPDPEKDVFYCLKKVEGQKLPAEGSSHPHRKSSRFYRFEGCASCTYAHICKKKATSQRGDHRIVELSLRYERYKEEARKNLLSIRGIEIRVNRSIQAEGSFGELKQNLSYIRLRRRGMKKVTAEIMMMAMAINIRKILSFYGRKSIRSRYWEASETTVAETFKKPKEKAVTN